MLKLRWPFEEAKLGKLHSAETKYKLSQMFSGEENPFFGKKHTSRFIAKLKERTGEANPMFNKEKSP